MLFRSGSSGQQTWSKAGQERRRMERRRVDGEKEGDGYDISYSSGAVVQEAEKEDHMSMWYGLESRVILKPETDFLISAAIFIWLCSK